MYNKKLNMSVRHIFRKTMLMLALFSFVFAMPANAQTKKQIKGTVKDAVGMTLPGVSVQEKGTSNGVITDADGKYNINASSNATLVFSFIGMATQEVAVEGKSKVDVVLSESAEALDEVVVTALGIKREKKALGYAVQEVKGDALVEAREPNVINSLSGKVAGVNIARSSNGPGGSSKIVIRGYSSLTNDNQPLIVVDGIPMDNFTGGGGEWSGTDMGSGMSDINPDDVESISILKGASAAALYGSRAGNGVILITTKKGTKKKGIGVTYSSNVSFESILTYADVQNSFGQGANGVYDSESGSSWGPKIEGQEVQSWTGKTVKLSADKDGFNDFLETGVNMTNSIALDKAGEDYSVRAAFTNMDNSGIIPNVKLKRNTFTLRGTADLGPNKKWHLDSKISFNRSVGENRPALGRNQYNMFNTFYLMPRTVHVSDLDPAFDEDGNRRWFKSEDVPSENPYFYINHVKNTDTRDRLLGFTSLKYEVFSWLNAEVKYGLDYYTTQTESKIEAGGIVNPNGRYDVSMKHFLETNGSFLLTAHKRNFIGDFDGSLSLGGNMMHNKWNQINGNGGQMVVEGVYSIGNGFKPTPGHSRSEKKINSLYGTGQIAYKNYAFLDFTFRNDWSSALSSDNRSFFYPSASLGLIATDMIEDMGVDLPDYLTFVKFRASYAEVGNDLPARQLETVYSVGSNPNDIKTIARGSTLYNKDVKSELKTSREFGADIRLFDNRFTLDFTYYKENTTNQLIPIPMPEGSGYARRMVNTGDIQNKGMELMATAHIFRNNDGFNWSLGVNYAKNENTIEELDKDMKRYELTGSEYIKAYAEEGQKYGVIYGYDFKRVTDENSEHYGKIIVDDSGLPLQDNSEFKHLGDAQPDFSIGVSNQFSYKNLSLSFLIDAKVGGDIYSGTLASMYAAGTAKETADNDRKDFIVPNTVIESGDGDNKTYAVNDKEVSAQNYWGRVAGRAGVATPFIYEATSVRLRELVISYRLPKNLLKKTFFTSAKVSFVGRNLWLMYSDMPGIDPESVYGTNTNAPALETFASPTTRTLGFNISLSF